jgi:hypothetical protein
MMMMTPMMIIVQMIMMMIIINNLEKHLKNLCYHIQMQIEDNINYKQLYEFVYY